MSKTIVRSLAFIIALSMLFTGCAPKSTSAVSASGSGSSASKATDTKAKELIIGTYMPVTTLVPWKTTSDGDGYIIRQIYHTLLELNKKSEFTPSLAKSWECSKDGLTWTFHLRDDIYWQTGNKLFNNEKIKVTAEDVKYSYDYYLKPETGSVRYSELSKSIKSIEVVDPTTVKFVTNDIDVLFENKMYQSYIIPRKAVESGWDFGAFPVGSGAYKFVEHVVDTRVVLEKNKDYWKAPALDKITFKIITDKSVSAIALQNKEIDIALAVLPTEVAAVASKDFLKIDNGGTGSLRWVGFNCANPLFTDPEIRRALSMAIDIDGAVKAIFSNSANIKLAIRAYGPIIPERPGFSEDSWKKLAPTYDPKEAVKILEAKGWKKGADGIYAKDGKRFSFNLQVGNNDANREKLSVIVSSQLKAIGIECTAKTVEWGAHTTDIKNGTVEMYILGGYGGFDGGMRLMHSDATNFSPNCKYSNKEVDALLDQAWKTVDTEARNALLTKASDIFVKESAHLAGYYEYAQIGYNKRVTDFSYANIYYALCNAERNVGVTA